MEETDHNEACDKCGSMNCCEHCGITSGCTGGKINFKKQKGVWNKFKHIIGGIFV